MELSVVSVYYASTRGLTMTSSGTFSLRSQSFLLIFLLLGSGMLGLIPIQSADADSARSTGSESLNVEILGDYYDRGTNITLVATATNLDSMAEYTLEYTLCRATGEWNDETEIMEIECTEWFEQVSGTIELGSGNSFSLTATSIQDTGCCDLPSGVEGFENGTMMFLVNLTSQYITTASSWTGVFVLGNEIVHMDMEVREGNILLGMDYDVHTLFELEFYNLQANTYSVNCSLIDPNGTVIDTSLFTWSDDRDAIDSHLVLQAVGEGEHYPHCTLSRVSDNSILASQNGATFEVIKSNYSGYEAVMGQTDVVFYEHNNTIDFTIVLSNLYIGAEYAFEYTMCYTHVYYDYHIRNYIIECGDDVQYGLVDDVSTPNVDESQVVSYSDRITVTPTASTHVEQVSLTLPSCCGKNKVYLNNSGLLSIDSLENESLTFDLVVSTRNVTLDADISNTFVLGGEVVSDHLTYDRTRILIGMNSITYSRFNLDTMNSFTLTYTIECSLYNSTGDVVDTRSSNWNHNGQPGADIALLAPNPGVFHSECNLTRNIDDKLMGSQIGETITVIDVNYTANERHSVTTDTHFYPHNSTMEFSIHTTNMYPETNYTLEYDLCSLVTEYDEGVFETYCSGTPSFYSNNIPEENRTLLSGLIDFTASASSHTEVVTIVIPECCGDFANNVSWWLENGSMAFESRLLIQGVVLNSPWDESSYFSIGGAVSASEMLHQSLQLLPNMNLYVDMIWFLDHRNEFIQTYQEHCNFIDASNQTVLDSTSSMWNHRPEQVNTMNSIFSPPGEGEYYVECTLTRVADSMLLSTHTSENITVLPEIGSQDDATISVSTLVKPDGWALVLVSMGKLDAGQQYSINWNVLDASTGNSSVMDSGDFTWVEGTDSVEVIILEYNALADSTHACFTVDLNAADEILVSINNTTMTSNLCWTQNSLSDLDSDGVFDKNDECSATPYGSVVQTNGCSDADLDGWDDSVEIECNSDYQNPTSVPVDYDQDGMCDSLDDDDDNDGFTDEIEYLRGTNPYDLNDFPTNQLPVCTFFFTLEVDGLPFAISGEEEVSTLVIGTSSVAGMGTGITPIVTVPSGDYFVTVTCQDMDNDPVTISVNDVVVGPAMGEITASAMISLSADVSESVDANITWDDGVNSATTILTVNMENTGSNSSYVPGFTASLGILALLGAVMVSRKRMN